MKRRDLIKHLESQNCELLRECSKHSIYINRNNNKFSTIPRHKEINDFLAKKICKDLQIKEP